MPNGLYYYRNPGAILRRLFPKQLSTKALIIIWTIIFLINVAIVVLVQNTWIYPIDDFSKESLQELSYFEGCEILSIEEVEDYYVVYKNSEEEKRVARLEMFPRKVLMRAKIDKGYDRLVNADDTFEFVDTALRDALWTGNVVSKIAGIYVGIAAAMLLLEFFLFGIFHKLFRE